MLADRCRIVLLSLCAAWLADPSALTCRGTVVADEAPPAAATQPVDVRLIPLPLPITGSVDTNTMQAIDRALQNLPTDGPRPILVIEFRSSDEQTGVGSQFERSLALARFLAGDRLRRVRTVAYVPHSLQGHAILAALACEEIIIAPDATFGEAGIGESFIDPTMRRGYEEIAERRRVFPAPVAVGMLDRNADVFKVQTSEGVRYVGGFELDTLQRESAVRAVDRVIPAGEMGRFSGRELRLSLGFASHLAADKNELANALKVPLAHLQQDPSLQDGWHAVRVDLRGPINRTTMNWVTRSIQARLERNRTNFICFAIDSSGGDLSASLNFAQFLARLDPARVRTVAFVPEQARSDAALIALACQQLVIGSNAVLGGPGERIDREQLAELGKPLSVMAMERGTTWSLPLALVDSSIRVFKYTREGTGEVRYLSADELAAMQDAAQWKQGAAIATIDGLHGRDVEELGLAQFRADRFDEMLRLYSLDSEPETIRPNWAHEFIEGLADPKIAGLLLFVAWFALMIEFMTPAFTGAGLVSGICFVLYFWSQFLHGTAGWLEIVLFLCGVVCVLIEIFILPGFGVVGLTGGALMIVSIVLASQTFVIPSNNYQLDQFPKSLMMMVAAVGGACISLALMRRYMHRAPLLRRLMLPPSDPEALHELERRESLVDFTYLFGKRGTTTTPLLPSGKARFGDTIVDVISDGQEIARNMPIVVTEVIGNRVRVRPLG
jgi:membrane-bound ClpP family serine protease